MIHEIIFYAHNGILRAFINTRVLYVCFRSYLGSYDSLNHAMVSGSFTWTGAGVKSAEQRVFVETKIVQVRFQICHVIIDLSTKLRYVGLRCLCHDHRYNQLCHHNTFKFLHQMNFSSLNAMSFGCLFRLWEFRKWDTRLLFPAHYSFSISIHGIFYFSCRSIRNKWLPTARVNKTVPALIWG